MKIWNLTSLRRGQTLNSNLKFKLIKRWWSLKYCYETWTVSFCLQWHKRHWKYEKWKLNVQRIIWRGSSAIEKKHFKFSSTRVRICATIVADLVILLAIEKSQENYQDRRHALGTTKEKTIWMIWSEPSAIYRKQINISS